MDDTTQATWHITGQSPRTNVTATGGLEDGYTVLFVTGNGHPGSVFLPMARYTTDNVRQAVQQRADLLDAVGNLTGQG